jgi:hypothetical protein
VEVSFGPSLIKIGRADGVATGGVSTLFSSSKHYFSCRGNIDGLLDFEKGVWSWTVNGKSGPIDVDPQEKWCQSRLMAVMPNHHVEWDAL